MDNDDNDKPVSVAPKRKRTLKARVADSVCVLQREILSYKVYEHPFGANFNEVVVVTIHGRKKRAKLVQD